MDLAPRFPDLAGKVAVVTGGSRGIGAATVRALAANGARVAVNGRDRQAIDDVVAEATALGADAMAAPADVRKWDEIEAMRQGIEAELGSVDVLIAFAGGFSAYTSVHETGEDERRGVIDNNLNSTFLCIKAFLPAMIERRGGRS